MDDGREALIALRIFDRISAVELGVSADVVEREVIEELVGGRRAEVVAGVGSGRGDRPEADDDGFNSFRLKLEKTDPLLLGVEESGGEKMGAESDGLLCGTAEGDRGFRRG